MTKVFRDPVHNLIAFADTPCDRLLLDLVDSREVQRLRRIKQMGMTELVFPGANHSRFAHSLGVMHTARLFLDQLDRVSGVPLPEDQRVIVLAGALLHDVGHGPFSHAFEQVTGQYHEAFTYKILLDDATEVHQRLRAFDPALPDRVARFLDDTLDAAVLPAYLARVVVGQLDADRCDYLLRDSHASGTNYGDFDLQWMLAQLRPDPANGRFYLTRKGLSAAETYLFARFHMYRTVYFHKTSRAAEVMLELLFARLMEVPCADLPAAIREAVGGDIGLAAYLDLDDHAVTPLLKACAAADDAILRRLGGGLLHRRLYKAVDLSGFDAGTVAALSAHLRQRLAAEGLEPRYHLYEDAASDTPYEPYDPTSEKPSRQIYVESATGKVVEISALSEALGQLRRTYTLRRLYVPEAFRDELVAML